MDDATTRWSAVSSWPVVTAAKATGGDELEKLQTAVRKHRDERGDSRCYLDDYELYAALPEGYTPPPYDTKVELKNCERYIASRQDPAVHYVSPEREIERLRAALRRAAERCPSCHGSRKVHKIDYDRVGYDQRLGPLPAAIVVPCPACGPIWESLEFVPPKETAVISTRVINDLENERLYQVNKWGSGNPFDLRGTADAFDDSHAEDEWLGWINEYANGTGRAAGRPFRERMVKAAALCVAAIESQDRKASRAV